MIPTTYVSCAVYRIYCHLFYFYRTLCDIFSSNLGIQEKFCKADPGTGWDFSLKIEDLSSNKTTDDQQPEFRRLSEFYIIIFPNKLNIAENTKKKTHEKIKIKRLWLRLWGHSEINRPRTDVPAEPPLS